MKKEFFYNQSIRRQLESVAKQGASDQVWASGFVSQNFSAQGIHEYQHGQAISANLAKFQNAARENSGHKPFKTAVQ